MNWFLFFQETWSVEIMNLSSALGTKSRFYFFLILSTIKITSNTYSENVEACFYVSILVLIYKFQTRLKIKTHRWCRRLGLFAPTGQFSFLFLFGKIPHLWFFAPQSCPFESPVVVSEPFISDFSIFWFKHSYFRSIFFMNWKTPFE